MRRHYKNGKTVKVRDINKDGKKEKSSSRRTN